MVPHSGVAGRLAGWAWRVFPGSPRRNTLGPAGWRAVVCIMPPKRKVSGKSSGAVYDATQDPLNKEYLEQYYEAVQLVHESFRNIRKMQPKGISEGGHAAVFDQDTFEKAMNGPGEYQAACCIGWINEKFAAIHGVPYNKEMILTLSNHQFSDPSHFPVALQVVVEDAQTKPLERKGSLCSVTPEELIHAFYWAVARDIKNSVSQDIMDKWEHVMRTTMFHFTIVKDNEQLYYRVFNLREELSSQEQAMARTALQKIYEVNKFKDLVEQKHGKVGTAKLAELYRNNTKSSGKSEAFTDYTIQAAIFIFTRILVIPQVKTVILWAEGEFGPRSPFNSISKLHVLSQRSKDIDRLAWIFTTIADLVRAKLLDPAALTATAINVKKGAPGIIDLFMFKKTVKDYMLGVHLPTMQFPETVKNTMKQKLWDHSSYRQWLAPPQTDDAKEDLDLTWTAGWPQSAVKYMELVEQVVYGIDFDATLKLAMRMNKSAEETLQYQTFADVLEQIKTEKTKEMTGAPTVVMVEDDAAASSSGVAQSSGTTSTSGVTTVEVEATDNCRRAAQRVVSAHVKLMTELATEQQLVEALKDIEFAKEQGVPGVDYVGILIDGNLLAESITAPHIRRPPVNKDVAC